MAQNAPFYPLFPSLNENSVAGITVHRAFKVKGAKKPTEQVLVLADWEPRMSQDTLGRMVGGGKYTVRAFANAECDGAPIGAVEVSFIGAPRTPPPMRDSDEVRDRATAHESAQRAVLTIPGADPMTNMMFASLQLQLTNYREDALKAHGAQLELLQAYIQREKSTTLEYQLIAQLREDNTKLSRMVDSLQGKTHKQELEQLESEAEHRAKRGKFFDRVTDKVTDAIESVATSAVTDLLQKPDYVAKVAEIHANLIKGAVDSGGGNGAS
jgi:hypothetical protein